jgi:hypothetical protein
MDPRDDQYLTQMPSIPLVEVGTAGPVVVAEAQPARLHRTFAAAERHYGSTALSTADRLSEYWLARNHNPYREEIDAVATRIGRPGAFMLNLSFEWSCTAGVGPDPMGQGNRLLRTLDWPLQGLGRNVVVARYEGEEGAYDSVAWPGFVGVVTAVAPGRFSAAINQPPMRRWTPSCWLDWGINRIRMWRENTLPPVHLLRQVFDQCRTYVEARDVLSDTLLAMPALFTLSGISPNECCIIERTEDEVCVHNGPGAVANHWLKLDVPGRSRGIDSRGRLDQMQALRPDTPHDFSWVRPPILNATTRLSVIANAATGHLKVLGWECDAGGKSSPATTVYDGISVRRPGQFRVS